MDSANNIREARKRMGLTAQQVADYVGVTNASISMYENGKRSPSYEVLLKMGELFGCSVDYLLNKAPDEDTMEAYIFAIQNSPERRRLLDLTMWMPKDKLQKLIKLVEVWNE